MTALEGITVLDLTRLLPGGAATMWLASFGADVVKIEQPGTGDYARTVSPALFEATNCGKRSIEIDLKDPADRATFLEWAARADVVVESFRPGVMDRLGCGYRSLSESNPRLVYCAITGYGQTGPWRDMAGHDVNYIAMAGLLDLTGTAGGPPAIPGAQIADLAGGAMQAVMGILLALLARERSGRGQFVDVSMTDGVAAMLPVAISRFHETGVPPERGASLLTGEFACYNVYPTADGRFLAVGALEPKFWANLCSALNREDWITDQYAESRQQELKDRLTAFFSTRTLAEWWAALREVECCVTPVRTVPEVLADQCRVGRPIGLSDTPALPCGPAPSLGQHNQDVVRAGRLAASSTMKSRSE
jgi:crotonobetainyl-CoA:carnitine CoA-transferase CaiB-like acyl-CoA transferase